jgi:hypothetical protein
LVELLLSPKILRNTRRLKRMNNTIRNPEYLAKSLTPALPNFLGKLSPTQQKITRISAPQATKEPITCIEKVVCLARKHPWIAIFGGLSIAALGCYYLKSDPQHN